MNTKTGIRTASLLVVALPLFVAAGCAGNKQGLALSDRAQTGVSEVDDAPAAMIQGDAADNGAASVDMAGVDPVEQHETEQTAIATMDAYVSRLDQPEDPSNDAIEGVPAETGVTATVAPVAVSETSPQEGQKAQISVTPMADEVTVPAQEAAADPAAADEGEISPAEDRGILSVPPQLVFYFATNSAMPAASDNDMLLQHAEYLQEHPNMVLMIRGHADSRGAKAYNQRLSEKRAINVATILLAAGVSGEQLRIDGMGDDVPMGDSTRWQQNRRVEFTYMDSMVAKNN